MITLWKSQISLPPTYPPSPKKKRKEKNNNKKGRKKEKETTEGVLRNNWQAHV